MKWFRIASYTLLFIGISHMTGHFFLHPYFRLAHGLNDLLPANSSELKLLELMNEYKRTIGGSTLSMMDIQNGFSLCYSLFFLWIGVINLTLAKGKEVHPRELLRVCSINILALAVGTVISCVFFFWLPILGCQF
jgi:hypothetical protein